MSKGEGEGEALFYPAKTPTLMTLMEAQAWIEQLKDEALKLELELEVAPCARFFVIEVRRLDGTLLGAL